MRLGLNKDGPETTRGHIHRMLVSRHSEANTEENKTF
jgi:hypothetical protein